MGIPTFSPSSILESLDRFGLILLDRSGVIVESNRRSRSILNQVAHKKIPSSWIGANWADLTFDYDRSTGIPEDWVLAATKSSNECRSLPIASGNWNRNFSIACHLFPIVEGGSLVGYTCLLEQNSLEPPIGQPHSLDEFGLLANGIERNEPLLKELVDNVDGVFWVYDFEVEQYTYVSPAYERVFGVPGKSRGTTIEEWAVLVHPEDRERFKMALAKQRNGEGTVEEYRIACPEDNLRWVVDRSFPVFNDIQQVQKVVGVIRDISDRILSQERIAVQRAEMLHVSRLSALGLMSAALSHELNQPLSAIANYASACEAILQMQVNSTPDSIQDFIRRIIEQSLRAGEIVRRLRNFSRKSPTRLSTTNFNNILLDTSRLMTVDLRWRGIRLQWELNDELPNIQGDTIQLQQVFVNLLNNAADALQSLEASQRIIIIRTRVDKLHVVAEIEDRGTGIRSDILHRLFEPFVSTKVDGSGIGLSICQTILETHGGDIQALNVEPVGSRFIVRIPFDRSSSSQVRTAAESEPVASLDLSQKFL